MVPEDGDRISDQDIATLTGADRNGERNRGRRSTSGTLVETMLENFANLETHELLKQLPEFKYGVAQAIAFCEGVPGTGNYDFDRPVISPELMATKTSQEQADIRNKVKRSIIHTMLWEKRFLSREGSRERPRSLVPEMLEFITSEKRWELVFGKAEGSLSAEEKKLDGELIALALHFQSRLLLDQAFQQRQLYAENVRATREAMERGKTIDWRIPVFPDRVDWAATFEELFSGEFGGKVDQALRKIVEIGKDGLKKGDRTLIESPYAEGIVKTEDFTEFMRQLYEAAGKDMGAAWMAWRVALLWEIPGKFALAVKEKKGIKLADGREVTGYVPIVGDAPIVPDWLANSAFLDYKRLAEGGWFVMSKEGKAFLEAALKDPTKITELLAANRHLQDMFYNKIGLPLNMGRIVPKEPEDERKRKEKEAGGVFGTINPGCYLDAATGKFEVLKAKKDKRGNVLKDKQGNVIYEPKTDEQGEIIRNEQGEIIYETEMEESTFWQKWLIEGKSLGQLPWWETEQVAVGTEEATSTGSFQFWAAINRGRALTTAALVTHIPDVRSMDDSKFWGSLSRNWEKLGLDRKGRKWLVLSWMYPFAGIIPQNKKDQELGKGRLIASERIATGKPDAPGAARPFIQSILAETKEGTFLNDSDVYWVEDMLLKPPTDIIKIIT